MALTNVGNSYDINLKAGATLLTTTSQYKVVGMEPTSTTGDLTGYLANNNTATSNTNTARHAVGINQTYLSSTSEVCTVRLHGVSKVVCAASIPAGAFLVAYEGISTSTRAGQVSPVVNGITFTALSLTVNRVVLGRALEAGSTNTVIHAYINPQLMEGSYLFE